MTLFILKNNYSYSHVKKYAYKSENTLITSFLTKNNYIYNHVKKHTHKPQKFLLIAPNIPMTLSILKNN